MKRAAAPFALALLLDAVGAGAALLISGRDWQTVRTPQPTRVDVLELTGRTVDSAPTALALVALAGVVAVLATKGIARRCVGAVVALAGAGIVWRALTAAAAVSESRARTLVGGRHRTVSVEGVTVHVLTHPLWPALTVVAGVLVLASGLLVLCLGHRWQAMSAKYESPAAAPVTEADPARDQARAATALWSALDRGEDPTR